MSPVPRRALRVGGSIVLLTVVVLMLPAGSLQSALGQARPGVLVAALAAFLAGHVLAAFKWRMLMGHAVDVSLGKAVRAHFTGLVGALSPLGMLGGDIVRAGVAINGSAHRSAIMLTSVIDRLVDTIALVVLALGGVLWIGGRSGTAVAVLSGGIAVSVVAVAALIAGRWLLKRSGDRRLAGIGEAFDLLAERPALIARALLLAIVVQGTFLTANAYIGVSVGVESSFGAWLMAWPTAKFAAYLPVGVAGIGVRETALVALLRPFGGAAGPVMAAGLLWDAVLIVGAVGGWLALCVRPGLRAAVPPRVQTP